VSRRMISIKFKFIVSCMTLKFLTPLVSSVTADEAYVLEIYSFISKKKIRISGVRWPELTVTR
jgi:hypothetical protein